MAFEEEMNKRRDARRQEQQFQARQQRFLKIGLIMTAATLVICAAALLIAGGILNAPEDPALSTPPETTQPTEPAPTLPDTVIHIVAGGDVNVTDKTVAAGTAVSGYDYTDVFMDVVPTVSAADLAVLNFEGSIYGAPYGSQNKSAPTQLLKALQQAGVDLLQAANSQTVANGLSGLASTLQSIRGAGMEPLGAFATAQEFRESGGYYIREVQGIRVAFVAFTKGMEGMSLPAGGENTVNLLYKDYATTYKKIDTEGITAILQAVAAQKPDVTVAMLHWGSEYNSGISTSQEKIVKLLQENGVDAIVGTHPHVVQKVAFDEEKGTVVAYSLGDLLGPGEHAGSNYSILLNLQITKNDLTGEVKITGCSYEPVYTLSPAESGAGVKLVRIRQAMAMYENNHVGKVSKTAYENMKAALQKIEKQTA